MPRRRNQAIKEYKATNRQNGKVEKKYGFIMYAGINPANGKQRNVKRKGFASYAEAEAVFNQIQIELANDTFFNQEEDKKQTFRTVFNLWWESYFPTVRKTTAAKTQQWFNLRILPEFGDQYIRSITPAQVQKAVNRWSAEVVRYKTYVNYLNRIFKFAIVLGAVTQNPVDRIIIPKKGKPSLRHANDNYWNPHELEKFMAFMDDKPIDQLALFRTVAMAGLRRGELLGLRWRDVDLKNGQLHINHSAFYDETDHDLKLGLPKSEAGLRTVPIDPKTVTILKDWKYTQRLLIGRNKPVRMDQLVFPSLNNPTHIMPLDRPGELLDDLIKETKLPRITLHGFRHSYATWMYETNPNVTPKDMQALLGHETIKMTLDVYTHSTEEGHDEVVRFLNNDVNF